MSSMPGSDIHAALRLHQSGELSRADAIYREILESDPLHADAHHLLGVLAHQTGGFRDAVESIRTAIRLRPGLALYHCNLGAALQELGESDAAIAAYREALTLSPRYAQAHFNLGVALESQGRAEEAREAYLQTLHLEPHHPQAHNNLGNGLLAEGKPREAERHLRQALEKMPEFAEANFNLGNALRAQGQLPEACEEFRIAITLNPNHAPSHNNLGSALGALNRQEEAAESYRAALRIDPELAGAMSNLASILQVQGKVDEALAQYRRALELWPESMTIRSNYLQTRNYEPDLDPKQLFAEHREWEVRCRAESITKIPHSNVPDPNRRLRIGYVSPDFRLHPVASFLEPILASHDPSQVETYLYAEVPHPDSVTARFQAFGFSWRNTAGVGDDQLERIIRDDRIDILVDLAGHTAGNRLAVFTKRSAPIQVTYLGYCNTTGLESIDYRLTDAIADPAGEPNCHSEELLRLAKGFSCYAPADPAPAVASLPARHSGGLTFGSLHSLAKLNHRVLDLWCEVLNRCPKSRLLLARHTLTPSVQQDIRQRFLERGVPLERLELRCLEERAQNQHLSAYHDIDVALDVFPWSGHTTACEALWMGVPVITLWGANHRQRMVSSVLTQLELTEFVARNETEYTDIACRLSQDLNRLAELRAELRERMSASPLLDRLGFTRELERAYRMIWTKWCEGRNRIIRIPISKEQVA